jgi:Zn-finger nucleic acid-binding protein
VEVRHDEVVIDRCDTCGGVWLDAGELELLTKHNEGGWFSRFRK